MMENESKSASSESQSKDFANLASAIEIIAVLVIAYLWASVRWSDMRWPHALGQSLLATAAIAAAFSLRWYGLVRQAARLRAKEAAAPPVSTDALAPMLHAKGDEAADVSHPPIGEARPEPPA